ncbi:glyoxalase superfamily protein [Roseobacteraceae bacterium S113]
MTGHNYGAARWDRSNGRLRVALVTSVLYCGAIQLFVALFPGWVGQAFVDDPATIAEVVRLLPIMAHRLGYRDWNALHAVIGVCAPGSWVPGGRVRGRYVSQPFEASVVSSSQLRPGWFRLALELDEPVDVVRFESFSNLRKRIQCVVGPSGTTREKTSDGQPHVVLEMRL